MMDAVNTFIVQRDNATKGMSDDLVSVIYYCH